MCFQFFLPIPQCLFSEFHHIITPPILIVNLRITFNFSPVVCLCNAVILFYKRTLSCDFFLPGEFQEILALVSREI